MSKRGTGKQKGMSLMELMVALTIGSLLMVGVGQIFMSNKRSSDMQNGMGKLQENARFALDILAENITMAGYNEDIDGVTPFNSVNTLDNVTENVDLDFLIADGTASDSIDIRYRTTTDCLGNAVATQTLNRFYINGTDLMCLGSGSVTPEIIATGIENMQILYGEDSDADNTANVFVNAGNVTDWDSIVTVRVALLVSTTDELSAGTSDTQTYTLLNIPELGPMNDRLLRRVFVRTVMLRNHSLN